MMNNPYTMLGVRQTATDSEIREALKQKIKLYCSGDESRKNSDGEYLREIFTNAAKSLLDKEARAKIDRDIEENNKKNGIMPYTENDTNQNVNSSNNTWPKINVTQKNVNMYLRQMISIYLNPNNTHTTSSNTENTEELLSLENGYIIIGEDGSCLLAKHSKRREEYYHNWFIHQLSDMLTGQVYHEEEQRIDNTTSWMDGKCISIFGVKSRVIPIMKFIPMSMLRNNKASKNDLQRLIFAIEMILTSNPEVLECLINPDGSTKKTITGSSKSLRIDQY